MLKMLCFTAEFCGPCKVMKPTIKQISEEYKDKVEVVYIDIEDNQQLAQQFGIKGVPTYVFVHEDKEIDRIVGATTKTKIVDKITMLELL